MEIQQVKCPTCKAPHNKDYIVQAGECHACVMKPVHAEMEAAERKDTLILDQVKNMVSENIYKFIENDLSEADWVHDFAIVDNSSVIGESQCDDDPIEFGHRVVNQTTNGGMSGDEYAGDVFIPISPDKFFKYSYSM